jgi:hypothetical protein
VEIKKENETRTIVKIGDKKYLYKKRKNIFKPKNSEYLVIVFDYDKMNWLTKEEVMKLGLPSIEKFEMGLL